ncbi:MAG: helix-turn-helix domain-containing protein [Nitriliruptoraceae bacterium]
MSAAERPERPEPGLLPPSAIRSRAELGTVLTALRQRSGRSLRDLAGAVGSSPSTLSGWCRADNLPFPAQYPTFAALLHEFGVSDVGPWVDLLTRLRTDALRPVDGPAPYLGLEPFSRDDASRFFGREALRDRIMSRFLARLADPDRTNLLVLVGASGSGKSSLLHAGIRPVLEDRGHQVADLSPGTDPTGRLTAACAEVATADAGPPPVLLVDQAEELFTARRDDEDQARFLTRLHALCAADAERPHAAVLTLRIDFYADLVATGLLGETLEDAQVLVGPMERDELRRAIVEPARQIGVTLDDDLVALLLRDFVPASSMAGQHDVGALPLLSHALLETYRRATGRRLTVADYEAAGGVRGAVERTAEAVFSHADPAQQALIRQVLVRLVHVENGTLATRRVATYDELQGLLHPDDDADVTDLLEPLIAARLLTAHATTLEITHEALLAAWPRLQGWIEEDRDAIRLHRRIAEATQLWVDSGRDPSALARGVLLDAMRAVTGNAGGGDEPGTRPELRSERLQLTTTERAFLDASVVHAEEQVAAERHRTRRLRLLVAVTTIFAVLAGTLAVVAAAARSDALLARDEALSRELAVTVERLAETDPSLAAELAVAGFQVAPTSEARATLLDAAIAPQGARILGGPGSTAMVASPDGRLLALGSSADAHVQLLVADGPGGSLERAGLVELDDTTLEIYALALAPDATLLAVGDTAARITLWDVTDPSDPRPVGPELTGPEGPIQGLSIAPNGRELVAVGLGDGAFRFDLTDPSDPRPLPLLPADDITWSVAHGPDGASIAVGTELGEVLLWDVTAPADPQLTATLVPTDRSVLSVGFAPDGQLLVAGSRAGTVHAYDLTAAPPTPVEIPDAGFDSWINALSFSPDGRHLAVGSSDGQLRLWERDDWTLLTSIPHPAGLTSVAFTVAPDTLLSAGVDGHARLWDLAAAVPSRLPGRIWGVGFSDDGARMAAFAGGSTGLWDVRRGGPPDALTPAIPSPTDGPVFSGGGALSPDGRLLAQGTLTGEVVLLEITDPAAPRQLGDPLGGSDALVETVTFTPDGRFLLAGGVDTQVRIWSLDDPAAPELLAQADAPTEIVLNLALRPDGQLLAVASADNHVYLVDLADPTAPRDLGRLEAFSSEAYGLAFSPDGRLLATSGTDAEVVVWDLADPAAPARVGGPIGGPSGRIYDLSWNADGARLAGAVVDGRVWVWDVSEPAAPRELAVLDTGASPIYTTTFHPDGQRLAAAGAAGQVWLWNLDEEAAAARICSRVADGITTDEWRIHLRDRPYDPPCG